MPPRVTPVVLNLIIINVLVFIALNLAPKLEPYFQLYKSNALGIHEVVEVNGQTYYVIGEKDGRKLYDPSFGPFLFQPVQLVTSFFAHFGVLHIFLNMFALFSFGPLLETVMGSKRFLAAYLICGLGQTTLCAFLDPMLNPVVGASGALFGIMVLFAFYFPSTRLGIILLPFQFPVKKFMIGAAVLSAALIIIEVTTKRSMGGISHFGHLAGMVMGFAYLHIGKLRKTMKR